MYIREFYESTGLTEANFLRLLAKLCVQDAGCTPKKITGCTRMKIPAWNLGENDTYFYSLFLAYTVWRFSILKYRRSFIFSNRSKEIDLFQA